MVLLVLLGAGIGLLSLFREEVTRFAKPWLERKGFVEEKRAVTLYFSDSEAEYLVGEKREVKKKEDVEEEARDLIRDLIQGPRGKLLTTLPPKTKLLSLEIDEKGIAEVNFSKSLSGDHPGGSSAEMMTVYSVVDSLAFNFPEIKGVWFLVEGQGIETIAGHLSLGQVVLPRSDLVKKTGKK